MNSVIISLSFEILLQLFLHFIDGDVEKLHLSGEFRESFFHKLLFAGFLDLLLGSLRKQNSPGLACCR